MKKNDGMFLMAVICGIVACVICCYGVINIDNIDMLSDATIALGHLFTVNLLTSAILFYQVLNQVEE